MFKIVSKNEDGTISELVAVSGESNLSAEQILKKHGYDPDNLDWSIQS